MTETPETFEKSFFTKNFTQLMGNLSLKEKGSNEKPLEFSDLTTDVIEVIIEKSGLKEQLTLRKVCKILRSLVDKQRPACRYISISCHVDFMSFRYGGFTVVYAKPGLEEVDHRFYDSSASAVINEDYEKMAFDDLAILLKNPKLQLEIVRFEYRIAGFDHTRSKEENDLVKRCYENFENVLKSLSHQVSLKSLDIRADAPSNLLAILPYLKPKVLEEIEINEVGSQTYWSDSSALEVIGKIGALKQWKRARKIGLRYALRIIPWKYLTHFKEFWIFKFSIHSTELVELRDFFAKLPNFEFCRIETKDGFNDEICARRIDESQVPVRLNRRTSYDPDYIVNYSIPGSDDYLKFKIYGVQEGITIKKKHR